MVVHLVISMPRAKDQSRGASERETMQNIENARAEALKAEDPYQLTALGKAFWHAQRKYTR